jgi:hypothetical protein
MKRGRQNDLWLFPSVSVFYLLQLPITISFPFANSRFSTPWLLQYSPATIIFIMSLRRHDTIRNTIHGMRSLSKAFKELTLSTADDAIRRTRERDRTIVFLSNLLDALKTVADPFLSSFLLDQLEIEIHQGLTGDQVLMGPFFSPWSAEQINAHPIDMDKHGTSQSLRRSKHAIDFGSPVPGLFDGPAGRVARVSGLIVQLMHCPRKPSGASLANIAGWRHS